jgi:hypothetical protein
VDGLRIDPAQCTEEIHRGGQSQNPKESNKKNQTKIKMRFKPKKHEKNIIEKKHKLAFKASRVASLRKEIEEKHSRR